jgi:hypothetical protein
MSLGDRIQRDRSVARVAPRPLTVVTPFGRGCEREIRLALDRLEARVVEETPLREWPRAASALYVRSFDADRLVIAAAYEEAWRRFPDVAQVWFLDGMESHARLAASKHAIRASLPTSEREVVFEGRTLMVDLHAFHVPDAERLGDELAILERFF